MTQPSFYEIIKVKETTNSISLENDKVEEAKTHSDKGLFVRALVNGNWGFSSSTEVNKKNVLKKAIEAAKHNPKTKQKELAPVNELNKSFKHQIKQDPVSISTETKIELLRDAKKRTQNRDIKQTKITYSDSKTKLIYENSENTYGEYTLYRTGARAQAIAKKEGEIQSAKERVYGTKGYEVFEENNFLEKCKEMGERASSLLDADSPPSGKYPTVLDPDIGGVFIHEALGHAAEGDLVAMDDSILKNKLGQKIGSSKVTVRDDASIKGLFGYYPFDWEGVESKETTIIKDGELRNYLNSRESSVKTNTPPTPNFRSQSYTTNPIVRMSNTYLESGDHCFEEIIEDIKKGVYLKGTSGGEVSTGEGNFQFGAEEGYLIKDGEIRNQIKDVSLSGKTLDTLKNIEKLTQKTEFTPGRCGKGGQMVPVTDGAPYTKLSEVIIGGQEDV